jgi:membrane-associated phospholipid phosphatase
MKHNILLCLAVLLFGSTIYSQDWDINLLKKINGSYTEQVGKPMHVFTESVTPVAIGAPLTLFCVSLIKKDKRLAYDGLTLVSAELINSIITTSMKLGIKRERPFSAYPNDINKHTSGGSYSYPSGHTSLAFTVATSLSLTYPKWYIILPSYVWASGIGYSRMYLGVHYPTDVLMGATVGTVSSVLTHYGRKYLVERKKKKDLSLVW